MAATVTTPFVIAAPILAPIVPSAALSPDKAFIDAMHLVALRITASGVQHLVITPPISRWDGSTWVRTYTPRA